MAENAVSSQGARGGSRRLGLYLPFVLLAVLALLWTGGWLWAADRAGRIADGFITREAERGRYWRCPERRIGGYPFRIEISCDKPQLVIREPDGRLREANLGSLTMHARVIAPGHIIALFGPPFIVSLENADMELGWSSARASVKAGLEGIGEASFEMADPTLAAGYGDRQDIRALAKSLEWHVRRTPGDRPGADFVGKVVDLTFAPLDRFTGSPEPLRLEFQASAPGLVPDPRRRFQDIVEEWRRGGNKARVILVKADKGQASLDLSGVMGLDEAHRIEGNLQGRAKGIDALAQRFTRRGGVDFGGLLGALSGGQGMPVALTFQNGVMRFGPVPLLRLEPLY